MRISQKDLQNQIDRINSYDCMINHQLDIGYAYGQPRVTSLDFSRNVSPRLPKRELSEWLDGFESGLSFASRGYNE